MLTETQLAAIITIHQNGVLEIRRDTVITKDDVVISRMPHGYCLEPGDSVDGQPERVKQVAKFVWTPECLALWAADEEARASKIATHNT